MTDRYGVIGNPVSHSLSPRLHALFAQRTGEDIVYERIQAPLDGFADTVAAFVGSGGKGANVTLPFKEEAFDLADDLSGEASLSKAVNTLVFRPDGGIYGDNTDGVGLLDDLGRKGCRIGSATVLVVGAGGACRGIIPALLRASPTALVIANRTHARAARLASYFSKLGPVTACPLPELGGRDFDGVINASSASLASELPGLPEMLARKLRWGYDLAYSKAATPFVAWLRAHRVPAAFDGTGMLICQAAASFGIWRGVKPEVAGIGLGDLLEK